MNAVLTFLRQSSGSKRKETRSEDGQRQISSFQKRSADAAEGALLGVCVGDAAGAPLEFPRVDPSSAEKV